MEESAKNGHFSPFLKYFKNHYSLRAIKKIIIILFGSSSIPYTHRPQFNLDLELWAKVAKKTFIQWNFFSFAITLQPLLWWSFWESINTYLHFFLSIPAFKKTFGALCGELWILSICWKTPYIMEILSVFVYSTLFFPDKYNFFTSSIFYQLFLSHP